METMPLTSGHHDITQGDPTHESYFAESEATASTSANGSHPGNARNQLEAADETRVSPAASIAWSHMNTLPRHPDDSGGLFLQVAIGGVPWI